MTTIFSRFYVPISSKRGFELGIISGPGSQISKDGRRVITLERLHTVRVLVLELLKLLARLAVLFAVLAKLQRVGDAVRLANQEELRVDVVEMFWRRRLPAD